MHELAEILGEHTTLAVESIACILIEEYMSKGIIGPHGQLDSKPWGSPDAGLYDPEHTGLVFFEDN